MAATTPTTVYEDFLAEQDSLEATIAALDPLDLADLDALAVATGRLQLVAAQLPGLRVASEDYEQGLIRTANIATQSARWATAASAKATALTAMVSARAALLVAMGDYNSASGQQQACLLHVPVTPQFRADYGQMAARLAAVIEASLAESAERRAWGITTLNGFDVEGRDPRLPLER